MVKSQRVGQSAWPWPWRRQRKSRRCGICGLRTFWWLFDTFEIHLGLSLKEAARCRKCAF